MPQLVRICVALILFHGMACAEPENPIDQLQRERSQDEYEEMLAELPDTLAARLNPLDTLFLAYDRPFLRPALPSPEAARRWADSVLATLSLEEKVGQLFIVELPASGLRRLISDDAQEAVETYHVGGFLVPRLIPPSEAFERTRRLQQRSSVPLFFAADYERGVGRFNNALTELPSNMALGATRDTTFAAAAGRLTAIESRATGINLVFAPVVDVNNNPANPIINIRSYGEDPELVGHMAAAYVHQAEAYGLLTTLKHFPGHGDTSVDSHARMGVIEGSMESLEQIELRPYEIVLDQRLQPASVMSTHLWIQALEDEPLPATFSRRALTDLLREDLGFDGFVVTDDVKMGALSNTYSLEDRVVRPLLAGADVILTPADLGDAVQVVKDAVQDGRLDEATLDRSVRRILTAKAQAGLHTNRYASEEALDYLMESPRGAYLAQAMANRAITLLKSSPALPLTENQDVTLVQISNAGDSESIAAAMDYLEETLEGDVNESRLSREPSSAQIANIVESARSADVVVLSLFLRLQSGRGEAGLYPAQDRLVRQLLALDVPVVLVTFGNPYAVTTYQDADAFLVAYDQTLESVLASARILQGRQQPQGKLPITVAPFPYGSGLSSL